MRLGITVLVLLGGLSPAWAAQRFTERFTGGSNGWTTVTNVAAPISFVNDQVRANFGELSGATLPTESYLVASNLASGGSFTGNYLAAGIQLIGFSLKASGTTPGKAWIYLERGSVATQIFASVTGAIAQTGVWYTVGVSLASAALGGWTQDPPNSFTSVLQRVTRVRLRLEQASGPAQEYLIDDFYLGGLPAASLFVAPTNDSALVTWTDLRTNLVYTLQFAETVAGVWSNVSAFTATGTAQTVATPPVTNGTPGFYRLLQ